MADLTQDYNLPKESGIAVEDCEDFVHIKYQNEVKVTYSKAVEPNTIKKGIKEILSTAKKSESLISKL